DRLESSYKDLPGQWDRIWINEGSANNVINYAIIKNGFIGVHAGYSVLDGYGGSNINSSLPKHLSLTNTKIQNCSFAGLLAHYYNITGGNDVISNCGKYLGVLQYGGNYSFTQCTFANYWSQTNNSSSGSQTRTTASYFLNNYVDASTILPFDSLYFANCILDGNLGEEFQYDTLAGGFNHRPWFQFAYCLMKTQGSLSPATIFPGCLNANSSNPSFVNAGSYNFHLNINSGARNTGSQAVMGNWFNDIENNPRLASSSNPDMGAYAYH
ncbi:MAG TPA: hypothetical protein VNY73_01440, partial [Bacteroidia bacterium]|nr:hypothetical protein [Bacteroidia bacterium]